MNEVVLMKATFCRKPAVPNTDRTQQQAIEGYLEKRQELFSTHSGLRGYQSAGTLHRKTPGEKARNPGKGRALTQYQVSYLALQINRRHADVALDLGYLQRGGSTAVANVVLRQPVPMEEALSPINAS